MRPARTVSWQAALACAFLVSVALSASFGPMRMGWGDPDTYMRLAVLEDALSAGHMPGGLFLRDNAPWGMHSHWSLPFNALVALLAAPVAAVSGWHAGLNSVQFVCGPLSLLALACATIRLCTAAGMRRAGPWAVSMIALSPAIVGYGLVGRVNHHIWTVAIGTAALAAALSLARRPTARSGAVAAGWVALCAWQSMETVPAIFSAWGVVALAASLRGGRPGFTAFALSLPMASALILAVDGPWPSFGSMATDRFSLFHASMLLSLGAGTLAAVQFSGSGTMWPRALRGCMAAGAAACLWAVGAFMLRGDVAYRPEFDAYFWNQIAEVSSVWVQNDPRSFLPLVLMPSLPGLLILLLLAVMRRMSRQSVALTAATLVVAAQMAVGCAFIRASPYAAVLGAAVMGAAARAGSARILASSKGDGASRVFGFSIVCATLLALLSALGTARDTAVPGQCDVSSETAAVIEAALPSGAVVAADIWPSPQLLWRTKLRTVAGPYHTNRQGITDLGILLMGEDGPAARQMVAERGVSAVLVCGEAGYIRLPIFSATSLARRLGLGDAPSWLEPINLPAGTDLKFYRVRR